MKIVAKKLWNVDTINTSNMAVRKLRLFYELAEVNAGREKYESIRQKEYKNNGLHKRTQ